MSKILRLFTVSLLLASIMIASFAGAVFAAPGDGDGDGPVRDRACDCEYAGQGPEWDR